MKILFIILSVNLFWFTKQHLSSDDLCKRLIHQSNCPDSYNYTCKSDKCSVNKEACKRFNHKKYQTLHSKSLVVLLSNLEKYEKFLKSIKKCPSEWESSKVCLNIAKCSTLKFNNETMKFNKISEKCKCIGEHSFGWGKLCAVDRKIFKAFRIEAKINKKLYENLLICTNGMKLVCFIYFYILIKF